MYQFSLSFSSIFAVTNVISSCSFSNLLIPSGEEITVRAMILLGLCSLTLSIANYNDPPVASIGSRINTFLFSRFGKFS